MTPKRPEATCFMALQRESPLASRLKRFGFSPPSPVLLLPPRRFMAMAIASWASLLMEPKDMAPVLKRFTMVSTSSTSSIAMGLEGLNFMRPRNVHCLADWSSISFA